MVVQSPRSAGPHTLADWLRQGGSLSVTQIAEILSAVATQVTELHAAGHLHRGIGLQSVLVDPAGGNAALAPPQESAVALGSAAGEELCPPELADSQGLDVPLPLADARRVLSAVGSDLDPAQIDVYQLATLGCRLFTGEPIGAYLRSPRARGKLPGPWRPVFDRALGGGAAKFASMLEFAEALQTAAAAAAIPDVEAELRAGLTETPATGSYIPQSEPAETPLFTAGRRAPPAAGVELPFTRLGRYDIVSRLGRGGMGDVYQGYDASLRRPVAIKVLPEELARHADFVRRFRAEASAVAKLSHPNVLQIHFIGSDAGHHFFVMQFVEGESLAQRLKRAGRLDVRDALALIEPALRGLAAAHAQGLVHRDIKPGNILLDKVHGEVLLADFGLVKSVQDSARMTATGMVLGTVDYLSPEQGRGQPVDGRADLYSMGVVLFEMLSGRLPFRADDSTALIFQHVYEQPPALHELDATIPQPLSAVVARLLAKTPGERHQTAEEVLADLQAVRNGQPLAPETARRLSSDSVQAPAPRQGEKSRRAIIAAPRFEPAPLPPDELDEEPAGWWLRLQERMFNKARPHAPELFKRLQKTQQQVDGALAEYKQRQRRLRALVEEAEAVLAELEAQRADWNAAAEATGPEPAEAAVNSPAARLAQQKQAAAQRQVAELQEQINAQREHLVTMRVRLSQGAATLQKLVTQRDLLNARLQVANAQLRAAGVRRGRLMPRGKAGWLRAAGIGAAAVVLAIVLLGRQRSQAPRTGNPVGPAQKITGQQAVAIAPAPRANSVIVPAAGNPSPGAGSNAARPKPVMATLAIAANGEFAARSWHDPNVSPPRVETALLRLPGGTETIRLLSQPHKSARQAISRDGTLLISAGKSAETGESELKIWDVATGAVRHRIEMRLPYMTSVGFSPDGATAYAVIGRLSDQLAMINTFNGTMETLPMPNAREQASGAGFSPVENLAAIAVLVTSGGGRIAVDMHDLNQLTIRYSLRVVSNCSCLTFSEDGQVLVGADWGTIKAWRVADGSEMTSFVAEKTFLDRLAISPDRRLVAALQQNHLKVWNLATGIGRQLEGLKALDVAFAPTGTLVVAEGSALRSFDPATLNEL